MMTAEKRMQPKVKKALNSIHAEAVARTARGEKPVPQDFQTEWAKRLYASQIVDGAAASLMGWTAGKKLVKPTKAAGVGIGAPDDFLTSPTTARVKRYFELSSEGQAQTQAAKIDRIFQRVKREEVVNPSTGEVTLRGLAPKEIARALASELTGMSGWESQMIARTGSIWAHNEGAEQSYKAAGLDAKQWYATADELTCEFCADLHQEIIEIDSDFIPAGGTLEVDGVALRAPENLGVSHPPAHPSCRCVLLPVTGLVAD
jgi:hypothetical protein